MRRRFLLVPALCAAVLAGRSLPAGADTAAGCPGMITQDTTLAQNVVAQPGGPTECFHFAVGGITLNLNGHKVDIRPLHMGGRAVVVDGVDDATIEGPGTVLAYYDQPELSPRAFRIRDTSNLTIEGVRLLNVEPNGDPVPLGSRPGRGMDLEYATGANIVDNEVAYFARGIYLLDGHGLPGWDSVAANDVHDNAIGIARSFGIGLLGSSGWQITGNHATRNGFQATGQAGIEIQTGSDDNVISGNRSMRNLGPGISADLGTNGNTFAENVALGNGTPGVGPDLVDANPPAAAPRPNSWNADNRCRYQSGSIPPGVCGKHG